MSIEILSPVGRLVVGHPMVSHPVTDDQGTPKVTKAGAPQVNFYLALAIPKGGEQHWNQTEWGAKIYNEGVAAWPNGEYGAPTFAWKMDDGDSPIPNKRGKVPNQREGWAGNWILHLSNGFPITCYHLGRYNPHEAMQRKEEMKTGDYIRVYFDVKGNNPSVSPGVYLNPTMCELYQAGIAIVSENAPDPSAFAQSQGQLPPGAQIDQSLPVQAAVANGFPAPGAPVAPQPQVAPQAAPVPVAPQAAPGYPPAQVTPQAAPAPGAPVAPYPGFVTPGQ